MGKLELLCRKRKKKGYLEALKWGEAIEAREHRTGGSLREEKINLAGHN